MQCSSYRNPSASYIFHTCRGIWRIKCLKLWMSQFWFLQGFSLKILSRRSLRFVDIRVFIFVYVRDVKNQFSAKQGILVTWSRDSYQQRVPVARQLTGQTITFVLQCSSCHNPLASCILHMCSILESCQSRVTREIQSRESSNAHTLEFLPTFSHTTLTLFPPKYKVSNC